VSYFAADAKDLPDVGKVQVVVDFLAGPDGSDLDPSVTLIEGLVLRGEKRPS
jgi:hypothetical protein